MRPYFRGNISATAHPAGCQYLVDSWIRRARAAAPIGIPRRTLVIGCSSGIGIAARIATTFGGQSPSIGVAKERQGTRTRTGTAGWYHTVAFERAAADAGLRTRTLIGDAFADCVKRCAADAIRAEFGALDLLVYSVAAPRRRHPRTGVVHSSAIKTVGSPFSARGYDVQRCEVRPMRMEAATDEEVADTVAVMGGEDLRWWIDTLRRGGLLATGFRCLALSYIGVPRLHATYRGGTLGAAKDDLESTIRQIDADLRGDGIGTAATVVMRPLVTQSSLAIPMNLLYTMLLERVLDEMGAGEDVLDQGIRLIRASGCDSDRVDEHGRVRLDDAEQRTDVQNEIWRRWDLVNTRTVKDLAAVDVVDRQRLQLYGFGIAGIDYEAEVDPVAESDRVVLA